MRVMEGSRGLQNRPHDPPLQDGERQSRIKIHEGRESILNGERVECHATEEKSFMKRCGGIGRIECDVGSQGTREETNRENKCIREVKAEKWDIP